VTAPERSSFFVVQKVLETLLGRQHYFEWYLRARRFRLMVTLREAAEYDFAAIARLHADSWRSAYRGILYDEFLDNRATSNVPCCGQPGFRNKRTSRFL
jgi:hypothetical protein